MVQAPSKPLTLAEFLQLPETKPASEYINGTIIQKPRRILKKIILILGDSFGYIPCQAKLMYGPEITKEMVRVGWGIGRKVIGLLTEKRYRIDTAGIRAFLNFVQDEGVAGSDPDIPIFLSSLCD